MAMTLYLIRHAHAVELEDDASRPLSHKGRAQVRQLGRFFRASGALAPAEVWHSPLVRAVETATLLAKGLRLRVPLVEVPGLEPEALPVATLRRLARVRHDLAIVGHEPHLSALAGLLLRGRAAPAVVAMKKGACLALEGKGRAWQVRWLVTPGLLPGAR
jgi:phosphohistidine phosphatase